MADAPAAPAVDEARERRRGALLVAVGAVGWAAIGLWVQPLLDRGMEPGAIAFWRTLVGGLAFVVHASVTRAWTRQGLPVLVSFGMVGVALFYVALPAAIDTGGVSLAWLLLYTAPAWVALGAPFVLGERGDGRTAGLVALTVAGVALVAFGGGEGVTVTPTSIGWGVLAGLTYATWYFVTQKAGTGPVATGAVSIPVAAVALSPLAALPPPGWANWGLLVGLGLASTWLPALLYYSGIARLPAARAAVLATIEPVLALLFGLLVFGERLGLLAIVGAVVVLVAAVLAATSDGPGGGEVADGS